MFIVNMFVNIFIVDKFIVNMFIVDLFIVDLFDSQNEQIDMLIVDMFIIIVNIFLSPTSFSISLSLICAGGRVPWPGSRRTQASLGCDESATRIRDGLTWQDNIRHVVWRVIRSPWSEVALFSPKVMLFRVTNIGSCEYCDVCSDKSLLKMSWLT